MSSYNGQHQTQIQSFRPCLPSTIYEDTKLLYSCLDLKNYLIKDSKHSLSLEASSDFLTTESFLRSKFLRTQYSIP